MHQTTNTNNNSHRRQGPARRRQSRNANTLSPATTHKQYASENDVADMPVDATFQREFYASGPETPRKFSPPSPTPNTDSSVYPNTQSKHRGGNKNRSKNHTASPGTMKGARRTPPPSSASAKIPSVAAFAGATFHASPAPSSLPIPSFMAKSVPDSPGIMPRTRPFNPEPSPPPTDSERPTPVNKARMDKLTREESPLDLFFRADRAEKERARRASSANALSDLPIGPFSPPSQPRTLHENDSGPSVAGDSPLQHSRRPHFQLSSADRDMASQANNTPAKSMGPAFSTPYQDRIKAARSIEKQNRGSPHSDYHLGQAQPRQQQQHHQQQQQQQHAVDRSVALKQFLFSQPAQPTQPMTYPQPGTSQAYASSPARSQLHQAQGRSQSYQDVHQQSADLLAIEDGLRRILKLDSPLHVGTQSPAFANAHSS